MQNNNNNLINPDNPFGSLPIGWNLEEQPRGNNNANFLEQQRQWQQHHLNNNAIIDIEPNNGPPIATGSNNNNKDNTTAAAIQPQQITKLIWNGFFFLTYLKNWGLKNKGIFCLLFTERVTILVCFLCFLVALYVGSFLFFTFLAYIRR
jgi:hypothetical protein